MQIDSAVFMVLIERKKVQIDSTVFMVLIEAQPPPGVAPAHCPTELFDQRLVT
jgi:hypothetical protein